MRSAVELRARLSRDDILLVPGVYDSLSALLAAQAGAEAVYLSGASIAYTRFGRSDVGLVTMSEVAETLSLVAERIEQPVIVDADTGFGNALNVQRTVRTFERAGAAAIQIEDQSFPKRCGHLDGKGLVEADEMIGKIRAAADARAELLIVARTDAIAVEGLNSAIERASRYAEAGADILFVEAPPDRAAMQRICNELGGRAPLLANMVEGGKTPLTEARELEEIGYSIVIFPGGVVRAQLRLTQDYYASLIENGTTRPFLERMADFVELNRVIGTPELMKLGRKYEGGSGDK